MPPPSRLFPNHEELSKKDDDHRPRQNGAPAASWKPMVPRMRKGRLVVVAILLGVLYVFFKNMPTTLLPVPDRYDTRVPGQKISGIPLKGSRAPEFGFSGYTASPPPKEKPPPPEDGAEPGHYYGGPFILSSLASSLQSLARNLRFSNRNRNVLFAAANLQSASRVIPLACEMARWNRNVVHFAYMGRDDVSMEDLRLVNGVGMNCEVYWHDARPDFSSISTDDRMQSAVEGALNNIVAFMHPQIYITDDPMTEEAPFVDEVRSKASSDNKVLIELPENEPERLMWMTRLDTGSLSAWHKSYIDIVIRAPSGSSGSLERLLRSIVDADYFGARYPRISIEIPEDIDAPTLAYLDRVSWPPVPPGGAPHSSRLTLRRRISNVPLDPLEASIRTVESFYPARPLDSHILVLSPDVELSPMYFHYLFFHLLEYRYSTFNTGTLHSDSLAGISLITPFIHFDTQLPFKPPPPISRPDDGRANANKAPLESSEPTPFVWQAPEASATLYFGNRWLELHSFLSLRISTPTAQKPRLLPPSLPAFLEPLFELMLLRGYTVLYPNLPAHSIAIEHSISKPQPEFTNQPHDPFAEPQIHSEQPHNFNPYLPPLFPPSDISSPIEQRPLAASPLHEILPSSADLPELSSLPLLESTGQLVSATDFAKLALTEAATFRYMAGSCPEDVRPTVLAGSADDLFCDSDGEPGSGTRPIFPPPGAVKHGIVPGTGADREAKDVERQKEKEKDEESREAKGKAVNPKSSFSPGVADTPPAQGIGGLGSLTAPLSAPVAGGLTQYTTDNSPGDPAAGYFPPLAQTSSSARAQGHGPPPSSAEGANNIPQVVSGSKSRMNYDPHGQGPVNPGNHHVSTKQAAKGIMGSNWDAESGREVNEEQKMVLDSEFRKHLERQVAGSRGEVGAEEKVVKEAGVEKEKDGGNGVQEDVDEKNKVKEKNEVRDESSKADTKRRRK